jgi:hypothetical protein
MKAFVYTLPIPLNFSIKLIIRIKVMYLIRHRCFLVIDFVLLLVHNQVIMFDAVLMYSRNDSLVL